MGYISKKARGIAASGRATVRQSARSAPNEDLSHRPHQQEVMHRLRRVEGQIRGVLSMMERDLPCDVIAQQLAAARKALDRAFYEMMACSLEMEIGEAPNNSALRARIAEKTRLLAKYA
jgi:DNA-binding FrmR family transcriptional regulator